MAKENQGFWICVEIERRKIKTWDVGHTQKNNLKKVKKAKKDKSEQKSLETYRAIENTLREDQKKGGLKRNWCGRKSGGAHARRANIKTCLRIFFKKREEKPDD